MKHMDRELSDVYQSVNHNSSSNEYCWGNRSTQDKKWDKERVGYLKNILVYQDERHRLQNRHIFVEKRLVISISNDRKSKADMSSFNRDTSFMCNLHNKFKYIFLY